MTAETAGGTSSYRTNSVESVFATIIIVAIGLLNFALARNHGNYDLGAMIALIISMVLMLFLSGKLALGWSLSRRVALHLAVIVFVVQAVTLAINPPTPQILPIARQYVAILVSAVMVLFGTGVLTTTRSNWLKGWTPVVIIAAFVVICIWGIWSSSWPFMDVWMFQQDASAALAHGSNPYSITFPNIYGPGTPYYSPAVVHGDHVTFGYPYMPLPLLTEIGSWLVTGDVRYAHLACFVVTLAVLGFMEAGPMAWLAAAMLAMSPEFSRVNYYGWIEPLMFPWLALTAWAMRTRRTFTAAACFGLFLASKQYCIIFMPLAWYLLPAKGSVKKSMPVVLALVTAGAIPTLPLMLWDFKAFWYSAVTIQLQQPFRPDALSIPALAWNTSRVELPTVFAFVMLVPAYVFIFLRARRTPSDMMTALALIATIFFALNKQAFLNYYSLVVTGLAIGLAHLPINLLSAEPEPTTA